jgi:hypothetical protein
VVEHRVAPYVKSLFEGELSGTIATDSKKFLQHVLDTSANAAVRDVFAALEKDFSGKGATLRSMDAMVELVLSLAKLVRKPATKLPDPTPAAAPAAMSSGPATPPQAPPVQPRRGSLPPPVPPPPPPVPEEAAPLTPLPQVPPRTLQPQPQPQPPAPKVQPQPQPEPAPEAEAKPEVKAEPALEAEAKPEVKAEPAPEAEAKPEVKAEPAPEAEAKPEVKAEPAPEMKTAPDPLPPKKEEAGKSNPQDINELLPMPPKDDPTTVPSTELEEPPESQPESPKPVAPVVGSPAIPPSLVSQRIESFEPGEDAPSISPFVVNRGKDFSAATSYGKKWQQTVTENSDAAKNDSDFVDLTWNRTLEARRNGTPLPSLTLPTLNDQDIAKLKAGKNGLRRVASPVM